MKIFNLDSPFMQYMGKIGDLLIWNFLWMVCSIPIVTMGAATTALYYVTLKMANHEDYDTFRSFFKSFKENFKQSTIIWLMFLGTGVLLTIDLYYILYMIQGVFAFKMLILFMWIIIVLLWLSTLIYVFPLLSKFCNTIKQTLKNAFLMALPRTIYNIGILLWDAILIFLCLRYMPLLVIILPVLSNAVFLNKVFIKYLSKENE